MSLGNQREERAASFQEAGLSPRTAALGGALLIAGMALVAYFPSMNGKFVFDDNILLTDNAVIKSLDGWYRVWNPTEPIDFTPVSNTTLWVEWRLWGLKPAGYHVTNLLLHIAASCLLWAVLRKLSIPGAFLAALLFAVHPVNVESVAWIAQRRNVLAMFFFLLSILCYLREEEGRQARSQGVTGGTAKFDSGRWYWFSLLTFVLAMFSKGSVAILPIILLGIIFCRRRFTRWDAVRLAPFFVIAAALTCVNMWNQVRMADEPIRTANFIERLVGAGAVVWFYVSKELAPIHLVFVYPQWHIQTSDLLWWLPLSVAIVLTTVLWWNRNRRWGRPLLWAWIFFCVALLPVLGFTDVGFMKYSLVADHYQHIATIGVVALAAAAWSTWHDRSRGASRSAATAAAVVLIGALTLLSQQQSRLYQDPITLYETTLAANPTCWMAHNNLGFVLADAGRHQEAVDHYQQALRLKPNDPAANNNMGREFSEAHQPQKAIVFFRKALRSKPKYPEANNNLASALLEIGRTQEAIKYSKRALQLNPDLPEAHYNLANALANTGRLDEAIAHYQQALQNRPDYPEALNNWGTVLAAADRLPEAITCFQQAMKLNSKYVEAYTNLAMACGKTGDSTQAIAMAQKALDLARAQGQVAMAQQIETWLNNYLADHAIVPDGSLGSKAIPETP